MIFTLKTSNIPLLPDLFCGIMSARDCNGFAERKRTLKRRLADWWALECPQGIVTAS